MSPTPSDQFNDLRDTLRSTFVQGRELSLVLTKLDEAELWLTKVKRAQPETKNEATYDMPIFCTECGHLRSSHEWSTNTCVIKDCICPSIEARERKVLPSFTAKDWFTVTGRGIIATVDYKEFTNQNVKLGDEVVIDGQPYWVRGIERVGYSPIVALIVRKSE